VTVRDMDEETEMDRERFITDDRHSQSHCIIVLAMSRGCHDNGRRG